MKRFLMILWAILTGNHSLIKTTDRKGRFLFIKYRSILIYTRMETMRRIKGTLLRMKGDRIACYNIYNRGKTYLPKSKIRGLLAPVLLAIIILSSGCGQEEPRSIEQYDPMYWDAYTEIVYRSTEGNMRFVRIGGPYKVCHCYREYNDDVGFECTDCQLYE